MEQKHFKINVFIDSTDSKMNIEVLRNKFTEWTRQNNLTFCGSFGEIEDEQENKNNQICLYCSNSLSTDDDKLYCVVREEMVEENEGQECGWHNI